jgi:hypothetical protein
MTSLKTEGFNNVVSDVADKARLAANAAKVVRIALTLDDRFGEESGLGAVTPADRVVVESVRRCEAGLTDDVEDRLFLIRTGRLAVRLDGDPAPADAYLLAGLSWADENSAEIKSRSRSQRQETEKEIKALHDELAGEPAGDVDGRLTRIEYAVAHMAPVLIYVNDHVYSNLGKFSNLPGKSLSIGHQRSVLTQLRGKPVVEWAPEDACFVACLDVLLSSGPPVRAEEFNGTQLTPVVLASFLAERITEYGTPAALDPVAPSLRNLTALAATCSQLRKKAIASGRQPYRVINGLTLHKREHLMTAPTALGDVPGLVMTHLSETLGADLAADTRIDDLAPLWVEMAGRLPDTPAPAGFSTAFEAVLHAFLTTVAEAFAADVSMSRGPQKFDSLRVEPDAQSDPFSLGTGHFYCCVTPRQAFVQRFGGDRQGLVRTLAAYSARMRFNTWHYLPHTLGIAEREPGREDWFFAPTMPDIAEWSDQHHTGHVAFGVRYAIRVPLGIEYDGRQLPGLYDLRLMRTDPPPFTGDDLRGAIAAGRLLRQLYQAMSEHEPPVTDFAKNWYESFHG